MRIPLPSKISRKLLLAILPLVTIGVSAIVWMQYVRTRGQILPDVNKEIHAVAERGARNIDDLLRQRRGDLFTLSETPLITDYYHNIDYQLLDEAETYRWELEQYLLHFAQRSQVYARILYLDRTGREVCRIDRDRIAQGGRADPSAPHFAEARKLRPGAWWASPITALPESGWAVYYAKPVHDETGRLAGVLVLCYDLSEIGSILKTTKVGRTGQAFILTAHGVFPPDAGPELAGRDILLGESPLKGLPWRVVVQAPLDEFLGPLRTIRNAAVFTAFLGIGLLLVVLLWLVRSITRPVAALADAARRIGEGDLGHRIAEVGQDELGVLSAAFNQMAANLEANRRLNSQLQTQLVQAEKLSAAGQLISSVAHELRQPLSAVRACCQMFATDGCSPGQRRDLDLLTRNALRCSSVVENLLFFVRQSRQERRRVGLNDAVASALDLLDYRLRNAENVAVVRELDPEGPAVVGDLQEIVQVLVNLVNNACDAMASAARQEGKRLVLRTAVEDGGAVLSVADNGPGIPAADREKVFEPFFTTKEPGRGTGLGLPICRQIVERCGGALTVSSQEGRGATFKITLPLPTDADLAQLRVPEARADLPAVPVRRILVVDDEEDIAQLIARLMREDGDVVDVALRGAEALRLIAETPYDLVISDFSMEQVKGDELFARLREARPAARMLFVTGDLFNPKVLNFLDQTDSPYVVKPFDPGELRQAARRLLAAGAS